MFWSIPHNLNPKRTLEDFIKFLRPSEAASEAGGESEKASGEGEKVKKIEL